MRAVRLVRALRSVDRTNAATSTSLQLDLPMASSSFSSLTSISPRPTAAPLPTTPAASSITSLPIDDSATYQFGTHIRLSGRQLFFLTPLSLASVNLSPVVAGHALVLTRRVVARVADMTAAEVSDCFLLAQQVGRMLTVRLGASSLTFAVQDGLEAGQSVPHVHVHVMPRRKGDFQRSDDIYGEMEEPHHSLAEKEGAEAAHTGGAAAKPHMDAEPAEDARRRRTLEEMAAEATVWRQYMQETLHSDHDKPHT